MGIFNNKVNKNSRYRIEQSGSQYVTGSVDDNFYVSKPIPASDFGYKWITGSTVSLIPQVSLACGYVQNEDDISFISSSEFRVDGDVYYVPFIPAYLHKVDGTAAFIPGTVALDLDPNTYMLDLDSDTTAENCRIYISRYIGNFGYPSWKQIRPEYRAVHNELKRTSNLVVWNRPPLQEIGIGGDYRQVRERLGTSQTKYEIPYMSSKFRALFHGYEELQKFTEINIANPVNLVYDYSNLISYFPIEEIDRKLGVKKKEGAIYRSLFDKYGNNLPTNIGDFRILSYKEVVWPKEENTFLSVVRDRPQFYFNWREKREDRTVYDATNAMGQTIPTSSIWPLDARENYRTETLFTTASTEHKGDSGELMAVSSIYHNGDTSILKPSALFTYPMPDSSSAGVFFTNDTEFKICEPDYDPNILQVFFGFGFVAGSLVTGSLT